MNSVAVWERPTAEQDSTGIAVPPSYNYIGVFLTFRCPYQCSYCINRFTGGRIAAYHEMPGSEWIRFFERLETCQIPITLQGGEPGLHLDFLDILRETIRHHHVDILTNLAFDLRAFTRDINPWFMNRKAPYAPIRVSYHPEQFALQDIVKKVRYLMDAGFRVGIYGVQHPSQATAIEHAQAVCKDLGIDFRTKPFLGRHEGRLYGEYSYPEACNGTDRKHCECATSELLVAPDGSIHRCHYFLYNRFRSPAHIADANLVLTDTYVPCDSFGQCNPCDIKVKNNRFQQFGHVATRIRNIQPQAGQGL